MATLDTRVSALEAQSGAAADEELVEWGPGYSHFPRTTKVALRKMLLAIHDSGTAKLPIRCPAGRPDSGLTVDLKEL